MSLGELSSLSLHYKKSHKWSKSHFIAIVTDITANQEKLIMTPKELDSVNTTQNCPVCRRCITVLTAPSSHWFSMETITASSEKTTENVFAHILLYTYLTKQSQPFFPELATESAIWVCSVVMDTNLLACELSSPKTLLGPLIHVGLKVMHESSLLTVEIVVWPCFLGCVIWFKRKAPGKLVSAPGIRIVLSTYYFQGQEWPFILNTYICT